MLLFCKSIKILYEAEIFKYVFYDIFHFDSILLYACVNINNQ